MRVVFVREVVRVDDGRLGQRDQGHEVFHGFPGRRVLYPRTRVIQQHRRRILADHRRLLLLLEAHLAHGLVGIIRVDIVPGRAGAVGDHHARVPQVDLLEALEDTRERHNLQVVLVRAHGHVGRAGERGLRGQAVRHVDFRSLELEMHNTNPLTLHTPSP